MVLHLSAKGMHMESLVADLKILIGRIKSVCSLYEYHDVESGSWKTSNDSNYELETS